MYFLVFQPEDVKSYASILANASLYMVINVMLIFTLFFLCVSVSSILNKSIFCNNYNSNFLISLM